MAEGGPLGVTTLSCTCEPVEKVETDVADSLLQLGSVTDTCLVMLSMVTEHFYPSQRVRARASLLLQSVFFSSFISTCFKHSSCRVNTTAVLQETFILELMPWKHGWGLFIPIVRENTLDSQG